MNNRLNFIKSSVENELLTSNEKYLNYNSFYREKYTVTDLINYMVMFTYSTRNASPIIIQKVSDDFTHFTLKYGVDDEIITITALIINIDVSRRQISIREIDDQGNFINVNLQGTFANNHPSSSMLSFTGTIMATSSIAFGDFGGSSQDELVDFIRQANAQRQNPYRTNHSETHYRSSHPLPTPPPEGTLL